MANPYEIKPASPMGGMNLLFEGVSKGAEFDRQKLKKDTLNKKRQDSVAIIQNGTIDDIQKLMIENPDIASEIDNAYKFKNKATEQNAIDTAWAIHTGEKDPSTAMIERSEFVLDQGGDPSGSMALAQEAVTNPEMTKKEAAILLMRKDTAAWNAFQKSGKTPEAKDTKTTDIKNYEYAKKNDGFKGSLLDYQLSGKDRKNPLKLEQLINNRNETTNPQDRELYDQAIKKEIATPGQAKQRPFLSKLMADGWMPGTRITGPMLDAFESAAERANELGKPLTAGSLRKMEFEATKNRSTGSAAGSRLVVGRKQNIEAAQGLLKDLKKTSSKLNYTPVKFIASMEKWKNKQAVDPLFTEYMTQRADSLFVLGNALKQNGLTDKSIEVEEEAFSPTLSPKAFDGWYNTQIRALNRAAHEMNKDYGYGIQLQPEYDAGQAGQPTAEQPTPSIPIYNEPANTAQKPREITTQEEFNKLPSGAMYLEDGKQYRKP